MSQRFSTSRAPNSWTRWDIIKLERSVLSDFHFYFNPKAVLVWLSLSITFHFQSLSLQSKGRSTFLPGWSSSHFHFSLSITFTFTYNPRARSTFLLGWSGFHPRSPSPCSSFTPFPPLTPAPTLGPIAVARQVFTFLSQFSPEGPRHLPLL